jgi:hypothetical protein
MVLVWSDREKEDLKMNSQDWSWWLTAIILAIQEAEIERIIVGD